MTPSHRFLMTRPHRYGRDFADPWRDPILEQIRDELLPKALASLAELLEPGKPPGIRIEAAQILSPVLDLPAPRRPRKAPRTETTELDEESEARINAIREELNRRRENPQW